jgi:DNA polymerase-1
MDLSFMGWLPEIRAALDCAGVANLEVRDREADDVIATLASCAQERCVRVLSTDRDYFQLIGVSTTVVNPRERPSLVTEATVAKRYGVRPSQWCDFRALAGDTSDNIPGLPGVGMKKAAMLLEDGRTLDDIRDVIGDLWDDVYRWRELIRLRTDIDVDCVPTGEPTPRMPSPTAVCAELGLI